MLKIAMVVTENPPLEELSGRGLRRAMQAAHQAQAERWQRQYLPIHFKPFARSRYRYAPRSPKTIERKRRQGKPNIDHVDSGLARQIALANRPVKATATRATIRIPGPSYYTFRARTRLNLAAEITRLIPTETRQLEQTGGRALEDSLERERQTNTQRIQ